MHTVRSCVGPCHVRPSCVLLAASDRLGVSRQSVNAIEKGRYDPSLPLAFTIADVFELPIEEIFSRD